MRRSRRMRIFAPIALVAAVLLAVLVASVARPSLGAGLPAAQATPAATQAAVAEGANAAPASAYLTINPEAGFPLDPFLVSLQGGGPVEASTLSDGCAGYIPSSPAVTVDYKGKADLLRAFFYSDGDTTMVVQTPNGDYVCNDNTNSLVLDATVEITKPVQGSYNVWVGSASAKALVPGFLVFTSHSNLTAGTMALGSLVKRPTAPAVLPVRDRLATAAKWIEEAASKVAAADVLKAGGKAVTKEITANGALPAPELQTGDTLCGGLVTVTPDYAFDWSGDAKTLTLCVEANGDTTLLVKAPDGSFLCADDADSSRNLNPSLAISEPAAGRYLVWVGRVDPSKPVAGKLTLTEAAGAKPKALAKQ